MSVQESSIGFRIKSGWAAVVLLGRGTSVPKILSVQRIELSDPAEPESIQPYHAMEGRPQADGKKEMERLVKIVMKKGVASVVEMVKKHQSSGYKIHKAGLIVGSLTDPAKLGNEHIRWHALEGQLFRKVVEDGLKALHLDFDVRMERNMYEEGVKLLHLPKPKIQQSLVQMGREMEGPWRAEQKAACLAAWMAQPR